MQPRKTFREEVLQELMESITTHGLIQPLVVRRVGNHYELIAGERRFRAMQKLELTEAPVRIVEASDRDVLEMALVENLQREDLNPIEEAEAYCRLAKEFNLRQEDIATRVGKNRVTVANSMRLLDLAEDVKRLVALGTLTTGHAKAILAVRDHALQALIADMVVRHKMTVRQTEKRVQEEVNSQEAKKPGEEPKPKAKTVNVHVQKLQNKLRDKLSTHVSIHHSDKKGRIEIEYYGNDDLSRLLEIFGVKAD
jgi:ParB family chromosome partitioning protein